MSGVKRISMIVAAIVVAVCTVSAWRPVAAQATRSDDVLPALLVEVKGLRAAMEQMSSAGPRVQLAVSRLQLQEGRIGPRLGGVKKQVAAAQANVDRLAGEELQLTQDVAAEQARWTEINQRLDELERALAPKR